MSPPGNCRRSRRRRYSTAVGGRGGPAVERLPLRRAGQGEGLRLREAHDDGHARTEIRHE